jgi:hypothetical protein
MYQKYLNFKGISTSRRYRQAKERISLQRHFIVKVSIEPGMAQKEIFEAKSDKKRRTGRRRLFGNFGVRLLVAPAVRLHLTRTNEFEI